PRSARLQRRHASSPFSPYTTRFRSPLIFIITASFPTGVLVPAPPGGTGFSIPVSRGRLKFHPGSSRSILENPGIEKGGFPVPLPDRKSTRLNSSHVKRSYAVFCLKR